MDVLCAQSHHLQTSSLCSQSHKGGGGKQGPERQAVFAGGSLPLWQLVRRGTTASYFHWLEGRKS